MNTDDIGPEEFAAFSDHDKQVFKATLFGEMLAKEQVKANVNPVVMDILVRLQQAFIDDPSNMDIETLSSFGCAMINTLLWSDYNSEQVSEFWSGILTQIMMDMISQLYGADSEKVDNGDMPPHIGVYL